MAITNAVSRNVAVTLSALLLAVGAWACDADGISIHCGSTPWLVATDDLLLAVFVQDQRVWFSRGSVTGSAFSEPVAVTAVAEAIDHNGESRPKLAIAPNGTLHVTWTRRIDGPFAGEVRYVRSVDGGASFTPAVSLHDLDAPVSHRFDALHVTPGGTVHVVWIDKRPHSGGATARGEAHLFHAFSRDGGLTFSSNRHLAGPTCECCRLGLAAADGEGFVLFWRHLFDGSIRDHAFTVVDGRSPDGPADSRIELQRATFEGWDLTGCPHQGPHVIRGDGGHHLAWFTAAPGAGGLHYAFRDTASEQIVRHAHLVARPGADKPQLCADGDHVHYAWRSVSPDGFTLFAASSTDGGRTWQPATELARTQGDADHPQCVQTSTGASFAWHTASEGLRLLQPEGS